MNKFIGYREESHRQYLELAKKCPHLFEGRDGERYITDLDEINKFEQETGEQIGVIYQYGNYERLVVDLIENNGKRKTKGRVILPLGGVIIIPMMDGKFILEDQYRLPNGQKFLAFPRGHREEDFTPEEDAIREIEEELGGAKLISPEKIGKTYPETNSCAWHCDIVIGKVEGLDFKSGAIDTDGYEGIDKLLLLSADEIDERIANGEITCGYTLASWALYKARKKQFDASQERGV